MFFILPILSLKTELVFQPKETKIFYEILESDELLLSANINTISKGKINYSITPPNKQTQVKLLEKVPINVQYKGKGTYKFELTNVEDTPVRVYLTVVAEKKSEANEDVTYMLEAINKMRNVLIKIQKLNSQMADTKNLHKMEALRRQKIFYMVLTFNFMYILIGIWKNRAMKALVTPKR